ncbi:MAG: universal stress protein [Anaerolineae bacterium]|nr:MAG: universal stress protein [Anaerolineae bacterium]
MSDFQEGSLGRAVQDFREARRKAAVQTLMGRLTGRQQKLLSFDEIGESLRLGSPYRRYLDDIPLDSIVGSVGRYVDFTRDFLPLHDSDQGRWAQVRVAFEQKGLPPIEVYKIGDAYFVQDGNHRVSIARQLGATHIEAYVSEYPTRVSLEPGDDLRDVLLKAEYSNLIESTRVDKIRSEVDLSVTEPGHYREIYEHIMVHKYYLGLDWKREFGLEEAVASWVDTIYIPVVRVIRELGLLREFPSRTEADLYLWLKRNESELVESLGWRVEVRRAASDLVVRLSRRPGRVLKRFGQSLKDLLTPESLEGGPAPGAWRDPESNPHPDNRLFTSILVPVSGEPGGWSALEQAFLVARHEGATIRGLHVVADTQDADKPRTMAIREEFDRRCASAGIASDFAIEAGKVADTLVRRAAWTDLLVVGLSHPPSVVPIARARSGFRQIIQRSPRPVLAVPSVIDRLRRTLLAYDGSPKSEEALFLATYLATCWGTDLIVLPDTSNARIQARTEGRAREYLEGQGIQATYLARYGSASEAVLDAAREHEVDLIVMGGYGHSPLWNLLIDSTLDKVLRKYRKPVLVCR